VYEKGIASDHIHMLVRGKFREDIQNFFRVVAGHIAQEILKSFPISAAERDRVARGRGGAPSGALGVASTAREKENKFWQTRIWSRVVSWGREFFEVKAYVVQNTLEALGVIAYKPRTSRSPRRLNSS
jgi:hypothetical protein